jgi:hypothetical protein
MVGGVGLHSSARASNLSRTTTASISSSKAKFSRSSDGLDFDGVLVPRLHAVETGGDASTYAKYHFWSARGRIAPGRWHRQVPTSK